jgi:NMD protein affecting ribosome stability and mRNA decay
MHIDERSVMKSARGSFQPISRDQLFKELVHDSYKAGRKLRESTRCPDCGAVFQSGRWTWGTAAAAAHEERCPACHRIHDKFPAGFVALKGEFLLQHRDEILHLMRNHEAKEKAEHPLQRIMAVVDSADGVMVTTTDAHLARDLAQALQHAYKGELEFHYNKEDNLLRATWTR